MILLDQKELTRLLKCSRTTLAKIRKDPNFPAPVMGRLLWMNKDIERYVERSKC